MENVESLDSCDLARRNGIPFFSCKSFCKMFNIAKPVSILDGDIESMNVIYDYMMQFKKYFRTEDKNLFNDDITALEFKIEEHRNSLDYIHQFYITTS